MNGHNPWPTLPHPEDEGRVWLRWLVRLRWVAIFAQGFTVAATWSFLEPQAVFVVCAVVAVLVVGNLGALRTLARGTHVPGWTLLAHLALEVAGLTASLMFAGGPTNPFTPLFLVHVAMAAVMLDVRKAAAITALVLACYAVLHVWYVPLRTAGNALSETSLLALGGMVAFAITTVSVSAFVVGLSTASRTRKTQLLEARDRTAQTDRLRAVGTLAAGAAHELNTPLSTIGLRLRRIARRHSDVDTAADLEVMQAQMQRCKQIVEQLLVGAGDPSASGLERRPLGEFVQGAVRWWAKGSGLDVDVADSSEGVVVEVPRVAFTQALINLLENAREAQASVSSDRAIELEVRREGAAGVVCVRDFGCGLPSAPDRVGEPFFTTKSSGTGLGVFVARAVAQGAGGGLSYYEAKGAYTEARWWFPEATARRSA